MTSIGSPDTRLIIVRGNSGSGKSTVASAVCDRLGSRLVHVEQDHLRREVLREFDDLQSETIGLVSRTVRETLDRGYHVLLEGILDSVRYGAMLHELCRDHIGQTSVHYFSLSFEETARRHATRAKAGAFSSEAMLGWYRENDPLLIENEHIITAEQPLAEIVELISRAPG